MDKTNLLIFRSFTIQRNYTMKKLHWFALGTIVTGLILLGAVLLSIYFWASPSPKSIPLAVNIFAGLLEVILIAALLFGVVMFASEVKDEWQKKNNRRPSVEIEPLIDYRRQKDTLRRLLTNQGEYATLNQECSWFKEKLDNFIFSFPDSQKFIATPDEELAKLEIYQDLDKYAQLLTSLYDKLDGIKQAREKFKRTANEFKDGFDKIKQNKKQISYPCLVEAVNLTLAQADKLLAFFQPTPEIMTWHDERWLDYGQTERWDLEKIQSNLTWVFNGWPIWQSKKDELKQKLETFFGWPSYRCLFAQKIIASEKAMTAFFTKSPVFNDDFWSELISLARQQREVFSKINYLMEICHQREKKLLSSWLRIKNKRPQSQQAYDDYTEGWLRDNPHKLEIDTVFTIIDQTYRDINGNLVSEQTNWQEVEYCLAGMKKLIPTDELDYLEIS